MGFKRIAFSALGLKPWEFWRLTPNEFGLMEWGYLWREEQRHCAHSSYTAAQITAQAGKGANPRRIFAGVHGRGYLDDYSNAAPMSRHPEADEKKRALAKRAREKFRHLRNRGAGQVFKIG